MELKQLIIRYAKDNEIILGVCNAEPLELYDTSSLADVPFVTKNVEKRITPKLSMPNAQSIIVVGVGYKKSKAFLKDAVLRGEISAGAYGQDYHITVKKILEDLAEFIKGYQAFEYKNFVDTGSLVERWLAVKAGLGFRAKNSSIISKKFGSYFNIGYMLTDLPLEADSGKKSYGCGDCGLCVNICPGNAIKLNDIHLDYRKCISYLTQKKGSLTTEEMTSLGTKIYGCEACMMVCPHNAHILYDEMSSLDCAYPSLEELAEMSIENFNYRFKNTSLYWRGRKTIVRNAKIALNNIKNVESDCINKSNYGKNIGE